MPADYSNTSELGVALFTRYAYPIELAALTKPGTPGEPRTFNCGYGTGHTVKEVVSMFGEVLGRPLPSQQRPRRPGDPPALVCDSRKLQTELGWRPEIASLRVIVGTALRWEQRNVH